MNLSRNDIDKKYMHMNKKLKKKNHKPYPHVGSNVATKDVLAVDLSIELLVILGKASKPLFAVRNIQTTIQSPLQPIKINEFY